VTVPAPDRPVRPVRGRPAGGLAEPEPAGLASTDPVPPVGRAWIVAYVLAMVGVAAGWFGPIQILLPAQAESLAGTNDKEAVLAFVTGYGAAASMIANPVWGVLSDRSRSRIGRRRPVLLAGTGVGVAGLVVLALAPSVTWMIVGWVIVQIGLNGPLAALAAMIADRVPERRRGYVGALFGIAQVVGVVAGTAVAVATGEGRLGYLALAIAVPALVAALAIVHHEPARAVAPGAGSTAVADESDTGVGHFIAQLRPTRIFVWVWLIRLLLNLVNAIILLYLYFFLDDAVGVTDPAGWVLILTLINVGVTVLVAAVAGPLSDRWQRRRGFVTVGAAVLAGSALIMAGFPEVPMILLATVLLGVGWGIYIGVDLAIVTSVLPHENTRATALGVVNVASALPQVLAPVLAAPLVLLLGGYPTLYTFAAALAVVALGLTTQLRTID
jgi:MFS family permease